MKNLEKFINQELSEFSPESRRIAFLAVRASEKVRKENFTKKQTEIFLSGLLMGTKTDIHRILGAEFLELLGYVKVEKLLKQQARR